MHLATASPGERFPAKAGWRGNAAILLVVLVASGICILTWFIVARQIAFEREEAIRTAAAQNDDRALMLQQFVSRTLGTANLACLHVAQLHALGALPFGTASRPRLIAGRIARDPTFLGLSVVDPEGNVVVTTLDSAERTPNVSAQPSFAVHRAPGSRQMFVSRPTYSRLLRSDTIWLSRRLSHADGRFAGVVAVNLRPAQLTAIFGETVVQPSEAAWVVGLDGIVRARLSGNDVSSGDDVRHGPLFQAQRRTAAGRLVGPDALDGRVRLVSHRRVPGYPLYVSYSVLRDQVLVGPSRRARLFIVGAGLVTVITILLAGLAIQAWRERERRAAELAQAKARLEEAQRIAQIGDWTYSLDQAKVVWSPQLFEMYERDPALGPLTDEFLSLLSEESIRLQRESFERLVLDGIPASWELEVRLPSGRTRYHLVSAVPTRDRSGAIIGFHGTTRDITEEKRLRALQDELAQLSRAGALSALAATLSHELNQPLTAASNYLGAGQRLADRLPVESSEPIARMLEEARGQVLRAGEIIRRMRDLVSKGHSQRFETSIDQVLDEAIEIIKVTKLCPEPVQVVRSDEELLFEGDGVQIQQVVLNLVRNACESQTGLEVPPPRIEVSCDGSRTIVVSVDDSGPGFPEALSERLCEPFMTSKESGLGLGLSISRTIVESHGGTLRARNKAGGGAKVWFTLPLHGRRPRPALPEPGRGAS